MGNYLTTNFGANKDSKAMHVFAFQGASNTDITVNSLKLTCTDQSGRSSNVVRGIDVNATSQVFGVAGGQNVRAISATMSATNVSTNYVIYADNGGDSTSYGVYSTGKIASEKDIIAFVSSDKRLKTNIKPVDDSLNKIIKLNGVSFEWKDGYDDRVENKTNLGIIAQDVQEVIPEIVKERKDGYLAVQYDQLVPVLIEAVKDQQKQIDELKKKLEEL